MSDSNTNDTPIDDLTSSTKTRLAILGSVVAFIVIVGFMALIGAGATGYASLGAIPSQWFWLVAGVVLTATGWVFGTDLINEWAKMRG